MIDRGKKDVLGVGIDVVDYDGAATRIINAARNHLPLGVSALAVHGVMTGVFDDEHRYRLNRLGLVVPDGQPVRWALRFLYGEALPDRVWGPQLTIEVCRRAAELGMSIYLYGSRPEILRSMEQRLAKDFPGLRLAGVEASKFRRLGKEEHEALDERIRRSGADIVIVGLGCPRQEVFAFEHAAALSRPILAVGAAFDYYAGRLRRPPSWMQAAGLEWVYRLMQEPTRLWRRYLLLNPVYLVLLARQKLGLARAVAERRPTELVRYG